MNRDTATDILTRIRNGRRVIVLSETHTLARTAFTEVAAGTQDGERVRRANGEEQIQTEDGRGWVKFRSVRSLTGLRGISADVVLFDDYHPTRDLLEAVKPNIAG